MGGPLRNLLANIRENRQERFGGAQCRPSHFDACQTTSCGDSRDLRRAFAGSVNPVDLTKQTGCGGVIVSQPNSIVASSSTTPYASTTTVTSGVSPSASSVATPSADLKRNGMVTLSSGALAKIKADGTIEAVVPLDVAETKLQYNFSFKENGLGRSGILSGSTISADLGGIKIHESSADSRQMNITAKASVDTIAIVLHGGKTITISRAEINEAISTSATSSVAATTSSAPTSTPTPASEPAKAPEPNLAIIAGANELARLTTAATGWLYNSPVVRDYATKLTALLEKYPTLRERGDLVTAMGPEKLGLNLHEVAAFGEKVFDQIASPLRDKLGTLKEAVKELNSQYNRVLGRDNVAVTHALLKISNLGHEAQPLAATYWSLLRNNQSYIGNELLTQPSFNQAIEALKEWLPKQSQPTEATTPSETPSATPSSTPSNGPANTTEGDKLKEFLTLRPVSGGWKPSENVRTSFSNLAGALTLLENKSAAQKIELINSIGIADLTERLKVTKSQEGQISPVHGILGAEIITKLDLFYNSLSFGPLSSNKEVLNKINSLPEAEKKLLSIGWDVLYRGKAAFGRKSEGFQEQLNWELGVTELTPNSSSQSTFPDVKK
jgi:hypothetical protein